MGSNGDTKALTGEVFTAQEAMAIEAQTKGEIDIQVATAKRYPREITKSVERILELATHDREIAEKCWYALPRAGKVIEGPSVRMAEIVAASWGNLRATTRVISTDGRYVTCQGGCIDLESNFGASVEVKRRITTKDGKRYNDDMIMTTSNAASAIAFRNAIFKVVPGALLKDVMNAVKKAAMGDERTFGERLKAMLAHFDKMGIASDKVAARVGVKGKEDITMEHLRILRGLANAIEEGTTSVEEASSEHEKKENVNLKDIPNGTKVSVRKQKAGNKKEESSGELSPDEMLTILVAMPEDNMIAAREACGFEMGQDISEDPESIKLVYAAMKELKGGAK